MARYLDAVAWLAIGFCVASCSATPPRNAGDVRADTAYAQADASSRAWSSFGFAPGSATTDQISDHTPLQGRRVTVVGFGDYPVDQAHSVGNRKLAEARAAFVLRHLERSHGRPIAVITIGGPSPYLQNETGTVKVLLNY